MLQKMNALVYKGPKKIKFEAIPIPKINDNEVLMKIKSVGICGTDLHIYRGGLNVKKGTIPGHEFSGQVVKVGKHVTKVKLGDKVVGEHVVTCRKCNYCLTGRPNLCDQRKIIGVHRPGALAEYLSIPEDLVYKFPKKLSYDETALVEPLSISLYAVQEAGFLLGKRVAVIGQGPIGLLLDQVLSAAGAMVVGIDVRQTSLNFAKGKKWIHHGINSKTQNIKKRLQEINSPEGFDVVFEAVGIEATAKQSFQLARRDGDVYLLGVFSSPAKINMMDIVRKELNVFGSWTCAFSFPGAIDLLDRKKVNTKGLITNIYEAKDGIKAFADAESYKNNRIKTIIRF